MTKLSELHNEIEKRLVKLPKKCAGVLRGLWELKHLDEFSLQSILDAGDLSNDKSRLSAFATSFLFLRSQSVPVSDVIAMSKSHNRRINLWWSPKRWSEQHDRLARFETLDRLNRENVIYDVSYFERTLPTAFSGYIVRSSRRLGMEGLRQRHCVASWHSRLMTGTTAICAVFIDKVRWTVEVIKRENSDHPLMIGQIKSRFNRSPSVDIRSRIYAELGIEETYTSSVATMRDYSTRAWKENLRRLIPVFEQLEMGVIAVNFFGGGDSGSIDSIDMDAEHRSQRVNVVEYSRSWENGTWHGQILEQEKSLYEAVEDLVYDYLEETGVDWYNNDGGRGEFTIDVENRTIEASIDCYYTESNTEHSAEIEFDEIIME